MPRGPATLALAVAIALTATATASAAAHTKPWRCQIRDGGTNTEWGECMGREVASQEARLNRAWKKLLPYCKRGPAST